MAAMEDDVFFYALQKHCKIIESALMSKCNMNSQMRDDASQALGKISRIKGFRSQKRNPDIIVNNLPNEVNNDLLKVITEQNPEIVVDDESIRQCRVRFTLKTFQHTRHVVLETHPTGYRAPRGRAPQFQKHWFSPYSDARGDRLSEFISANNLFIINEDCGLTFRATQGTSFIDITVVGSDLLEDNWSWCPSENESLSDHVMIEFEFCLSTALRNTSSAPFLICNTKKANWCRLRKFCLSRMTHIFDTLNSCTNSSCLNTVTEELSFVIYQACLYSMPIKKTSKHNVPWWSIEIGCARKRLNASRRRFQRCKNPTLICWYLRRGEFLSSDQYGFTPHKSTEDALLRLNEIVKRGKKKHLHSILISLDIKGAFDNAWWPCILNLLNKAEIPINIFSLVADFLIDSGQNVTGFDFSNPLP
ncbi:hypothetical protein TNCV_2185591 [Trichonephila clavipes]|nr:hypothetical protein TNCV_2185591 [Trichonephila clavipes]